MVHFQDGGRCSKLNWLLHQCQKTPDLSAITNTILELSNHSIMVRSNLLKISSTSAATKRVEFFCIGKACTARKTKISITDLCSIFDQIPSFLPGPLELLGKRGVTFFRGNVAILREKIN